MNLLLLLSALLSALTGVVGGARSPQPAVAVARVAEAAVTQTVAVTAARPTAGLPAVGATRVMTGAAWSLVPSAPLFASRRRE